MDPIQRPPLTRLDEWRVQVGPVPGMRVPGIVYADEEMMRDMIDAMSLQQVVNVAHLPGIVGASLAMPDIHWGYGFPIGGVAAFDSEEGVISPGGVGYDIN
jgi:tRNA-splicing ligase RtcB